MLQEDVNRVVRRLPSTVREAMEERGHGVYVAGGFVRAVIAGERPSDVDLFVEDETSANWLADRLAQHPVHRSPFALSFWTQGQKVQVIHRWTFSSARQLLNAFDFTVARAAVWFDGDVWDGDVDSRFYQDLAARRLWYALSGATRADFEAGGTLLRMAKYLRRGYSIAPEDLADIALHAVGAGDPVMRADHQQLVEALREVDPSAVLVTEPQE